MIDKIRKIDREKMFLVAIIMLSSMYILSSMHEYPIAALKYLMYLMRIISYGLVALKFILDFFDKKYKSKELIIIFIIGLYLLLISYQSRTIGYLVYYIYIIVGKDVSYKKIITVVCLSFMISIAIVVALCKLGFIEDVIFAKGTRDRHGLGFTWATYFSNLMLFTTMYFAFIRRNKVTIFEIAVFATINIYAFLMTDTKSALFFSGIVLFSLILLKYIKPLREYRSFYKYIIMSLPIVLTLFIVLVSYFYNPNIEWMNRFNALISGRLRFGKMGLESFGVHLFAKHIILKGGDEYNYIDSAYIRYLVNFGIIFAIFITAYLTYFAKLISDKKDTYMFIIFSVLLLHSTFDPELLSMGFDYFLFVLSYRHFSVNEI